MRLGTKLEDFDLLISMAGIKHTSIKMKSTGKVSKKVEKKWKKRIRKSRFENMCCFPNKKCKWLPARVFNNRHRLGSMWFSLFIWECRCCHSTTSNIYEDEISESLQKAYSKHVLTHRWD